MGNLEFGLAEKNDAFLSLLKKCFLKELDALASFFLEVSSSSWMVEMPSSRKAVKKAKSWGMAPEIRQENQLVDSSSPLFSRGFIHTRW